MWACRPAVRPMEPDDPTPSDPPREPRSQRELDALARAVRKARAQTSPASRPDASSARRGRSLYKVSARRELAGAFWRRASRTAGVLAIAAVLAVGIDLAVGAGGRSRVPLAARRPPETATSSTTSTPTSTSPSTTTTSSSTTTTTSSTTTTIAAPGAGPVLVSVEPRQAGPGSVLVLGGRGFFSASGIIVAEVAGHPAPTRCPQQSQCEVTVPDLHRRAGKVPISITTSSGTSNVIFFEYL